MRDDIKLKLQDMDHSGPDSMHTVLELMPEISDSLDAEEIIVVKSTVNAKYVGQKTVRHYIKKNNVTYNVERFDVNIDINTGDRTVEKTEEGDWGNSRVISVIRHCYPYSIGFYKKGSETPFLSFKNKDNL